MPGTAILLTQQTIGLGARKTSMIFLAEAYRDLGYDVHVVTCQLSRLTRLKKPNKLEALPADRLNRWYDADGMHGYIWVAPVHPATLHPAVDGFAGPLLAKAYAASLPRDIRDRVAAAELVVVESCAAIALFDRIRRIAPRATSVYSMSDRLLPVGMHPVLQTILERDARHYSVVRTPARAMLADLPGANAVHIRHGLDKALFSGEHRSPFADGPNAVLVGDMMLDRALLGALVAAHPGVAFHYFGRTALDVGRHPNLTEHGEVPFAALVPYLAHADVGLSLYREVDDLDYLAESSLKNIQYEYCGLPIVAPHFVAQGAARVHGYAPGDPASASDALTAALAAPRGRLGEADVADWREVAEAILAAAR